MERKFKTRASSKGEILKIEMHKTWEPSSVVGFSITSNFLYSTCVHSCVDVGGMGRGERRTVKDVCLQSQKDQINM